MIWSAVCDDVFPGLAVIKLEYSLRLKIKCNDWLLADTSPQAPIIALYLSLRMNSSFINSRSGHIYLLFECVCRYTMYQRYMFHISRQLPKLGEARHW